MGHHRRRILLALALVCTAAAALRFATLDAQSLWYDESVTAQLMAPRLGGMLHALPDSESTPPLYYVLAWLWTQLLGTGEGGLRSLSALLGAATVPVVWALGRRLGGDRAALIAAALAAVNPMLVWFSQEARSYALLTLLGALSALLWLRALEQPRNGRLVAWGAVAALALGTHYFAAFLVAPQALWLALRVPGPRSKAIALALPAMAGAALVPLALDQRSNEGAAFIGQSSLATRLAQIPKQFLIGYDAPAEALITILAAVAMFIAVAGLVLALRRPAALEGTRRRDTSRLIALAAAALALPLAALAVGEDHVLARNMIAVLPLLLALAAAGFAAAGELLPRPAAAAPVAFACALGVVTVIAVAGDKALQRDDWRGAARALGPIDGVRIVAAPAGALAPLRYYLPHVHAFTHGAAVTREVDYLALALRDDNTRPRPPRPAAAPLPVPGFAETGHTLTPEFTVLRLRARTPQPVYSSAVATGLDGKPAAALLVSRP